MGVLCGLDMLVGVAIVEREDADATEAMWEHLKVRGWLGVVTIIERRALW